MEATQPVGATRRVVLQWVPADCGIPGNETADKLAKRGGANESQPENELTCQEKKTIIESIMKPARERDDYHLLTRQEQVTLFRLYVQAITVCIHIISARSADLIAPPLHAVQLRRWSADS